MDTMQCVHKAAENAPVAGKMDIFNQIMETFSVNELAERVAIVGGTLGYQVEVKSLENPRREAEEHYYNPAYQGLLELGVKPHLLTDESLTQMFRVVEGYKDGIRTDVMFRNITW
jgi:UDP-sulfoquinovose synthase